jgi:phage-related protein
MAWTVEYYEQDDAVQPAEVFEDALAKEHPKLAGKLARIAEALQTHGHQLGGGFVERCHGYAGLWEIRVIHNQWLGREFFGFDADRVVLLHGYVKRAGQKASTRDLDRAFACWTDYQRTHRISPMQEDSNEPV